MKKQFVDPKAITQHSTTQKAAVNMLNSNLGIATGLIPSSRKKWKISLLIVSKLNWLKFDF